MILTKPFLSILCFALLFLTGCSFPMKEIQTEPTITYETNFSKARRGKLPKNAKDDGSSASEPQAFEIERSSENEVYSNIFLRVKNNFSLQTLPTKRVQHHIKRYSRDPAYLDRLFKRSEKYIFFIMNEVEKRGLPGELVLLPAVESAYNPKATSRANAAGLWQFIPSTGRRFDLNQSWWIDERRDVKKSTYAALDYLESLHKKMDGDWFLALAAYNWGETSVKRAIKKNKLRRKKTGYLNLRMPRETKNYVPKLMALKEILLNPDKYNISLPHIDDKPYFEEVQTFLSIDKEKIISLANLDSSVFEDLNAAVKRPVLNKLKTKSFLLPTDSVTTFKSNLKDYLESSQPLVSWTPYKLKKDQSFNDIAKARGVEGKVLSLANGFRYSQAQLRAGSQIIVPSVADSKDYSLQIERFKKSKLLLKNYGDGSYRVKKGDTLSGIARKFKTKVSTLKRLNRINGTLIRTGQRLKISDFNSDEEVNKKTHYVRRGDSLYSIARLYKTSVSRLKQLNSLASDLIKIGTRIIVR